MLDDTQNNEETLEFIRKINSADIPVVIIKSSGVNGDCKLR